MDADSPDDGGLAAARSFLNSVSSHPGRVGDTSYLHPQFALRLANAIQEARASGLNVGLESGFRPPNATGSAYDASGMSLHDKGAAGDINGLGSAGSPQAKAWAAIAAKNGLYNPYGINDPREFNHWQLVPWTLEDKPDVQAQLSSSGGQSAKVWGAIAPTSASGLAFAPSSTSGTAAYTAPAPKSGSLASYKNALETPPTPVSDPSDALLQFYMKKPSAAPAASPAPAPASTAPDPGDALLKLYSKFAAPTGAAQPAPAAQGEPGSFPLGDPRNKGIIPNSYYETQGKNLNLPNDTVDPTTPAGQQLATAARNTAGYVGGQLAGIPGAIAQDYNSAAALNAQGNREGDTLPSFPSMDPRTWQAGGLLKSLAGVAGQVSSPLTGAVRQVVQDPVTQATGSPQAGETAGLIANTLAGPGIGRLAGTAKNALANATIGAMDPETAQLASMARNKYGIPVNAAQMSASPGVGIASSALNRLPFSGAAKDIAQQKDAWNNALAGTIGEGGSGKLTPDIANAARKRIGDVFDNVAANTTLSTDPKFFQDIHDTINDAGMVLPKAEVEPIVRQVQNILEKIDPNTRTISGETYQALTRKGTPLSNLLESDNPNIAHYAGSLKNALDDALQRSAPPEMQNALSTAKYQWRNLMTLKPLIAKATTGDISPALLMGAVNKNTGNALAFGGGGDLGNLARIGQRFLKEAGSSNTTERAVTYAGLTRIGALAGSAFGAHEAGLLPAMTPETMAASALGIPASLLAGRAIGSTLRSNWLANAVINRSLGRVGAPSSSLPLAALTGAGGLSQLNQPVNALAAPNP